MGICRLLVAHFLGLVMTHPDKISRFLPIAFDNGNIVRRFGKHCPKCTAMVGSEHMEGLASKVQNKIFLAAKAQCPQCACCFSIGCLITDNKKVHRVGVPYWLFSTWLKIATSPKIQSQGTAVDSTPAVTSEGSHPAPQLSVVLPPGAPVTRSEEVLGRFHEQPIHAWLECQGKRFVFERTVPNSHTAPLNHGELLFEDCLVYRIQLEDELGRD